MEIKWREIMKKGKRIVVIKEIAKILHIKRVQTLISFNLFIKTKETKGFFLKREEIDWSATKRIEKRLGNIMQYKHKKRAVL